MKLSLGRYWRHCLLMVVAALTVGLLAGCTETSRAPSTMESVHAGYLDLSANITDLRGRIAAWQGGDEASLKAAQGDLARTQVVLKVVGWPESMEKSATETNSALGVMARAVQDKDRAAADAASKTLGDASNDVTSAFYGDYIPDPESASSGRMAPHAIYLDLSANLTDLTARLAQWQKGDKRSLDIAKEDVDRIGGLILHLTPTGVMAKRLPALQSSLSTLSLAIAKADGAAVQQSLTPLSKASADLSRDAYAWMDLIMVSGKDDACVQASFLDLSTNVAELRADIGDWQKGNNASLGTAQERMTRVRLLLEHIRWPGALAAPVDRMRTAVEAMARALWDKDATAAGTASNGLDAAWRNAVSAYYDVWLPSFETTEGQVVAPVVQSASAVSGGHYHGGSSGSGPGVAARTDWRIVAGFTVALALVIGVAAVTKPKATAAAR